MLGAGLKDRTSLVFKMIRFLYTVNSPYEILEETNANSFLHRRFEKLEEKFNLLIEKAKKEVDEGKILFFKYSGDTSMSADLSNKLSYLFPEKIIVVAFVRGDRVNLSLRGEGIRSVFLDSIKNFENARGGGHENAVGCQLDLSDLDNFIKNIKSLI
jgi:nanoRNase/pAp phosphatase (c-di-AMP/oligoRNAs hydrolase)